LHGVDDPHVNQGIRRRHALEGLAEVLLAVHFFRTVAVDAVQPYLAADRRHEVKRRPAAAARLLDH
jgi:hypothetical protein